MNLEFVGLNSVPVYSDLPTTQLSQEVVLQDIRLDFHQHKSSEQLL